MFYVVFDHDMDWGDGGDCDTDVAEFTDRDTAINYARDMHHRVRVTDGCTDRWSVRRVMHDDAAINWAIAA